jgi:endoglucanase
MSAPRLPGPAFLACLAVGLAGCGRPPAPTTPDIAPAPRGRLRVAHGKLLDGDGQRLVLRGLGLGAIYSVKGLGRWDEAYFANARAWGAELVRVPVFPFTFRQDREQTLRDLDDALAWAERQSLYLIIDYHVMGNASAGQFLYGEFITWDEAADFWTPTVPPSPLRRSTTSRRHSIP